MSKKKDNMAIYASVQKKKPFGVDEDLTYTSEELAIKNLIGSLSSEHKDLYDSYMDDEKITVYLYQMDKDNTVHVYKSVEVEKDGDEFDVDDKDTYDLPEDFVAYGDSSDDSGDGDSSDDGEENEEESSKKNSKKDSQETEDITQDTDKSDDKSEEDDDSEGDESNDEEKDKSKKKKGSEKKEEDSEDGSDDDAREVEESSYERLVADFTVDNLYFYLESAAISFETAALSEIALEAVVGRKSVAEAKKEMKDAHKDVRKWFHYSHTGYEGFIGKDGKIDRDKYEKYAGPDKITGLINNELRTKAKYNRTESEYSKQRMAAAERLKEAKKMKRDKQVAELKSKATNAANNMRDKFKGGSGRSAKPVTEAVMLLGHLYQEGFMTRDMAYESCAALIAAYECNYVGECENSVELEYASYMESVDSFLSNWEEFYPLNEMAHDIMDTYMLEKVLKFSTRKNLEDDQFGIPSLRKYPIHDKAHVTAAVQRFNHVDAQHEKELAGNLIRALKKFDMLKTIRVNDKSRFKKYLNEASKTFTESYDVLPMPYTKEFSVGAMLPMMGSRAGWGTPLADAGIEDIIKKDNECLAASANLYDNDEIVTESFLPKKNLIFDGEAKKLLSGLKKFMKKDEKLTDEVILKKALNFKKTVYTFSLDESDGKDADSVITSIKKLGYKSDKDEGVKIVFEKTIQNTIITLLYDSVGDRVKLSYDVHDVKKEFTEYTTEAYAMRVQQQSKAGIPVKKIILTKIMVSAIVEFVLSNEDMLIVILGDDYDDMMSRGEIRRTVIRKVLDPSNITKVMEVIQTMRDRGDDDGIFDSGSYDASNRGYFRDCVVEASKSDIDEDIRPIIDKLNELGYKTKYSCSGHTKTRIKEDGFRNGIYNGSLYSTARIVFDNDYKLNPPKGWKKKQFDGKIGFYTEPKTYQYKDGVPDDAFETWKKEYMDSLREWVSKLDKKPGPSED